MKSLLELNQIKLWRIGSTFENEPHKHDDSFQLSIAVGGCCEFNSEHHRFTLQPGEALVQLPGERHHFRLNRHDGVIIFQMKLEAVSALWSGSQ
jgi:AraC family transcriptional regulator